MSATAASATTGGGRPIPPRRRRRRPLRDRRSRPTHLNWRGNSGTAARLWLGAILHRVAVLGVARAGIAGGVLAPRAGVLPAGEHGDLGDPDRRGRAADQWCGCPSTVKTGV